MHFGLILVSEPHALQVAEHSNHWRNAIEADEALKSSLPVAFGEPKKPNITGGDMALKVIKVYHYIRQIADQNAAIAFLQRVRIGFVNINS